MVALEGAPLGRTLSTAAIAAIVYNIVSQSISQVLWFDTLGRLLAQAGVEYGDTGQPGGVVQVGVVLQSAPRAAYCLFDTSALQQEIIEGLAHGQRDRSHQGGSLR